MKMRHIIPLVLLAMMSLAVASCTQSPLDKALKRVLVKQDTTQAQFDSNCAIILQNPDRYKQYLTEGGQVNITELQALIERVGNDLRPPMQLCRAGSSSIMIEISS